jgi:hypothetical protein
MLNPEGEVQKIEKKIADIMKGRPYRDVSMSDRSIEVIETIRENVRNLTFADYQPFSLKSSYRGYFSDSEIQRFIKAVVDQESPVYIELVAKRLREFMKVARIGKRLRSRLLWAIGLLVDNKKIRKSGEILWAGEPQELTAVRISAEKNRPSSLIPHPELGTLALEILRNGFSIEKNDLITEMARTYKYSRTGVEITKHFGRAIGYLKKIEKVEEINGRVQLT